MELVKADHFDRCMPTLCFMHMFDIAAKKSMSVLRQKTWAYMYAKTGMEKEELIPYLRNAYLYGNIQDGGIVILYDRHPVTGEQLDTE